MMAFSESKAVASVMLDGFTQRIAAAGIIIIVILAAEFDKKIVLVNGLNIVTFKNLSSGCQLAADQGIFGAGKIEPVLGSPVIFQTQPGFQRHGKDRAGIDTVTVPGLKIAV